MATEKVRIVAVEIGGEAGGCRVLLSDGKELDGLLEVALPSITADPFLTVQINAVISRPD